MERIDRRHEQFVVEKALRARILNSPPHLRAAVVSEAYSELFERFPDHSVFDYTDVSRQATGRRAAGMIAPLCRPGGHVLEVGCGRGDVLAALAERGMTCVGIEPSQRVIDICEPQAAVRIVSGTANRLEFADSSFDVVFSQQVLEHLHPDDVAGHLAEAFRVLRPGGVLAVETPNQRTGPQDISRGFTSTAEGLHLKEWSWRELVRAFRNAGFTNLRGVLAPPVLARQSDVLFRWTLVPGWIKHLEDVALGLVPGSAVRRFVAKAVGLDDLFLIGRRR